MSTDSFHDRLQSSLGAAYALSRELGGGGMSRVFLAREAALERDVVVKVLSPDLAAGVSAERFTREIKLAARLQQANIVPLLSAGETEGLSYYTMPFIDGLTLRATLERNGALPLGEAISVLRDITRALAYAHEHGVVHRDIKPENILLSGDAAVVTDFGIAKALAAAKTKAPGGTLTQVGTSIGTPAYMAPEQAAGDPATDHRADLYALGCVAYEMLAGAAPFAERPAHQLFAAHMNDAPAPLESKRPDVPRALAQVVARCLAKDPAMRPQSAREVRTVLDGITGFGTTSGRSTSSAVRAAVAAVAVIALVTAAVVGGRALRARGSAEAATSAERSIAVLPFENLGDSADAYFADGVTDAVRGKLGELPGVRVIARASSNQYRASTKSPQQIGAELGVQYLLTATVRWQKHGTGGTGGTGGVSRVQVRPELIMVRDAMSKWQEPFDAALTDVFQVQAEIAGRVAGALDVALGDSVRRALATAPTGNLAAYDAYLKAQAALQGGNANDPGSLRRAMPLYEQAVALDPSFALAWSGLALNRSILYFNSTPTPELARQAREAAERAESLAPGRAEGAAALGVYYRTVLGDLPRALTTFESGLRTAPNDVTLLTNAARVEQALGRWEAALPHARRARALDPRSPLAAQSLTWFLLNLRRYPEAQAAADSALALAPGSFTLIELKAMVALGRGDLAGARTALSAAPATVDRAALLAYFAYYYDLCWVPDDAEQQQMLALPPSAFDNDRGNWGLVRAQIYHLHGDQARVRIYADSARLTYEEQLRAAPRDAQRHVLHGLTLAYLGRKTEAIAEGERAMQLVPLSRDATLGAYFQHQLARIYILIGERKQALDVLERLLKLPYFVSPGWLRIDPTFSPLQGDPRFERLAAGR